MGLLMLSGGDRELDKFIELIQWAFLMFSRIIQMKTLSKHLRNMLKEQDREKQGEDKM